MAGLGKLVARRDSLIGELGKYKYILRGTITRRGNICGKANCRCKRKTNSILHGPYRYLSHRSRDKTNMIFLNKKKTKYAIEGIRGYQKLIKAIYEISEINFEILRYHYNRLGEEL